MRTKYSDEMYTGTGPIYRPVSKQWNESGILRRKLTISQNAQNASTIEDAGEFQATFCRDNTHINITYFRLKGASLGAYRSIQENVMTNLVVKTMAEGRDHSRV